MSKSMANVELYFKKSEIKKDGEVPVLAIFSVGGKQDQVRIGESFPLDKIEGRELRPGKDQILNEKAKRIRAKLSLIEIEMERAITQGIDIGKHIRQRINEEGNTLANVPKVKKIDFFKIWAEWEDHNDSRVSQQTNELVSNGTKKNYKTVRDHLKTFSKSHPLDITNIGKDFYSSFAKYVLVDNKLESNTFGNYMKIFRTFMRWADEVLEERGIDILRKYMKFKSTYRYKGVEHLSSTDLKLFREFESEKVHLRTARDLFLMMCYTGLSVGDLRRLRSDFEYSADRMLLTSRRKTINECVIPLFDDQVFRPVALLDKYEWKLPYMPDSKINKYIKEIAELVGFTRFKLETRIGRKTFATIKHLEQKVPSHIVMRATGHKTEKNFLRYIGTDRRAVIDAFEDGAQFLKVS